MAFYQKPKQISKKSENQKPILKNYSVQVEIEVPANLIFKISAENPEQALQIVEKNFFKNQETPPLIEWNKLKKKRSKVCNHGTISVLLRKEY